MVKASLNSDYTYNLNLIIKAINYTYNLSLYL